MLTARDLSGRWTLRLDDEVAPGSLPRPAAALVGRDVPASVPGCVHADLLAAGVLPDPFVDDNETRVAWVGRTDWAYRRPVSWPGPDAERVDLVFDGVDTVATVLLGGHEVGRTRNMHRRYRFDVTSLLGRGEQDLQVRFTSAYTEAQRVRTALGPRPAASPEPFNFVRKMACSFGWDWGPTLVTAGIWRPVRLEGWSVARLAEVRPLATLDGDGGLLDLTVEVERTPAGESRPLSVSVELDGVQVATAELAAGATACRLRQPVPGVALWWPRGYGSPATYDLTVALVDADAVLDRWRGRTGFRSVSLDCSPDASGRRFVLSVNGEPVLVKGVNWIPDDIFPARVTGERYRRRLGQAAEAGANLVRVWGGGIYEGRDFYEACDDLGLLVWQDFLFACACYPEEEPLAAEVAAEARDNVSRLSAHPSLVLWNGNNENLWLREAAGWDREPGGDRSWGESYYLRTLPAIVAELDPSRPYAAGTPWSGSWEYPPNSPDHQTFHSWDVWNRDDYLAYRASTPRFVAEFGWQAPPAWATMRRAVTERPLTPRSTGLRHHQKADDGMGKLARGLAWHFAEPGDSAEAWHYLTQLNQVRAVRTGVEHWRSHWPHTAGMVLWQLNDLWPAISWSAIDGDGRLKPVWFALRSLYADRLLTVQPRGDGLVAALCNDHDQDWAVALEARLVRTSGVVVERWTVPARAPARTVLTVPLPAPVARFQDPAGGFLVASAGHLRALWFGSEDRDFALPDPSTTVRAVPVPGGLDLHVHAAGLARDVLVQPDRIHPAATADRGFVTLLPGEQATFRVRCPEPLSPSRAAAPWVVASQWDARPRSGPGADNGE